MSNRDIWREIWVTLAVLVPTFALILALAWWMGQSPRVITVQIDGPIRIQVEKVEKQP